MPATKLIKIRKAVVWQYTKIRGAGGIVTAALLVAAITMPYTALSQETQPGEEWVVVIDAGHGGKDPGTVGPKAREKNINLAVALRTGKYIQENLRNVKVVYTRDDDTFIGLAERAEVANRNKADIFISIHSNWISDKRITGAETWVLGQSMDEANLKVAMKENSVITFEKDYQTKYEGYDPNSVESFIIFSLMQNTYLKQSTEFASMVQNQFRDRAGRKDRGVKQAGFMVLWMTTMPSVLVELGFVSNSEEEKYLLSPSGQEYLASAIFRAFRDYKQAIDSRSGPNANGISHNGTASEIKGDSVGKPSPAQTKDSVDKPVSGEKKEVTVMVAPAPPLTDIRPTVAEEEILFMVQIMAMPIEKQMSPDQLKDIGTVTRITEEDRVKYAAGRFPVYDDAVRYRRLLSLRFPDAFVIAVRNGKIIPLNEGIETKKTKQQ